MGEGGGAGRRPAGGGQRASAFEIAPCPPPIRQARAKPVQGISLFEAQNNVKIHINPKDIISKIIKNRKNLEFDDNFTNLC